MEPAIFFASFGFFPIQVPSLYSFSGPVIASGLRLNGTPISRCSALTMPHFLQDVSPSKLVTHACLPPTGQIEFEANSITTFTTVKKITRTMKTENMSDFDDILAKIKELKEKTTKTLEKWEPKKIYRGEEMAEHLRIAGQNTAYRTLLLRDSMLLSGPEEDNMMSWLEKEQEQLSILTFENDVLRQQGLIEGIKTLMDLLAYKTLQQKQQDLKKYEREYGPLLKNLEKVRRDEFEEFQRLKKSKNTETEVTREKWEVIREMRDDDQWMDEEEAKEPRYETPEFSYPKDPDDEDEDEKDRWG